VDEVYLIQNFVLLVKKLTCIRVLGICRIKTKEKIACNYSDRASPFSHRMLFADPMFTLLGFQDAQER